MAAFQSSTKLEALREEIHSMLAQDPSAKCIVFSQFTSMLDLVQYRLSQVCMLPGCTALLSLILRYPHHCKDTLPCLYLWSCAPLCGCWPLVSGAQDASQCQCSFVHRGAAGVAWLQVGVRCVKMEGSMSLDARNKTIKEFNESPNVPCFLMSLKAGGVALNLTVASHVMLMDPWWNPAVEQQAQVHQLLVLSCAVACTLPPELLLGLLRSQRSVCP